MTKIVSYLNHENNLICQQKPNILCCSRSNFFQKKHKKSKKNLSSGRNIIQWCNQGLNQVLCPLQWDRNNIGKFRCNWGPWSRPWIIEGLIFHINFSIKLIAKKSWGKIKNSNRTIFHQNSPLLNSNKASSNWSNSDNSRHRQR